MNPLCDSVHAFADGELSPAEAEQFSVHLASCANCQAELGDIMQLATGAAELHPVVPLKKPWYRRAPAVAAVLLPLAAAILLTVLLPRAQPALPAYTLDGPSGFVAHTRGSTVSIDGPRVFVPEGMVAFKLLPSTAVSGHAPAFGLFVASGGAPLMRVKDVELRATEQGAFAVRAGAKTMFGSTPGQKTIYLVVAPTSAELDAFDGRDPGALENRAELRVHSASVEYRLAE